MTKKKKQKKKLLLFEKIKICTRMGTTYTAFVFYRSEKGAKKKCRWNIIIGFFLLFFYYASVEHGWGTSWQDFYNKTFISVCVCVCVSLSYTFAVLNVVWNDEGVCLFKKKNIICYIDSSYACIYKIKYVFDSRYFFFLISSRYSRFP